MLSFSPRFKPEQEDMKIVWLYALNLDPRRRLAASGVPQGSLGSLSLTRPEKAAEC